MRPRLRGLFLALAGVSFWNPAAALEGETRFEARGSPTGDASVRLLASVRGPSLGLRLGAESAAGPTASLRHAAFVGATASAGPWESDLDFKVLPSQAGAAGLFGAWAVRRDLDPLGLGLTVDARRTSQAICAVCPQRSLSAVGLSAEVSTALPWALKGSARAAAWAVELRGEKLAKVSTTGSTGSSSPVSPWERYGASTLDWAERWDLGARLERDLGLVSASVSASLGAPAQDAALCQRASLAVQRSFGRVTVSLGAGVAHLTPSGQWLSEASLSAGVHLGGVP